MYVNLGYHGVKYKKCEKMGFLQGGLGTCMGKFEWFKYYFSVIFG